MSRELEWVEEHILIEAHDKSLARDGGGRGVRDINLLRSAMQRPPNRHFYEQVDDVVELAATYAAALSQNHPFIDGNKRAAFHAMGMFLRLNDHRLTASTIDAAAAILRLAAGEWTLDDLAAWLRENVAAVG